MYITLDMLYTLQDDELYGGARRRMDPEATAAQEKADGFKEQIRENDPEFLDEHMEFGRVGAERNVDKMLTQKINKSMLDESLGFIHADAVAKTLTRDNVVVWLKRRLQMIEKEKREAAKRNQMKKQEKEDTNRSERWEGKPKEEIIQVAFELTRGSLAATLKRARLLTSQKITMDDVKKWRLENTNKEKKTNRKFYNSWVCNEAKDEYQVYL